MKNWITVLVLGLLLVNCIGTDQVEDTINSVEIIPPENVTEVNDGNFAKVLGQEVLLEAEATSDLGGSFLVADNLSWMSADPSVATVDEQGLLSAVGIGSTMITVTFSPENGLPVTDEVMVSVAGDPEEIVLIEITSQDNLLIIEPGSQLQLSGTPLNASGEEVTTGDPLSWTSSDTGVALVSFNGTVQALTEGEVRITATMSGVSGFIDLIVDADDDGDSPLTRTGEFQGLSGYNASGDVSLVTNNDGSLSLQLASNFETSNGPGLYLYLSNSSSGISGGVELGELEATSGEQEYDVPSSVTLDEYQYVVLYCKPFGVGFGTAELSE